MTKCRNPLKVSIVACECVWFYEKKDFLLWISGESPLVLLLKGMEMHLEGSGNAIARSGNSSELFGNRYGSIIGVVGTLRNRADAPGNEDGMYWKCR